MIEGNFQDRIKLWMTACFGETIANFDRPSSQLVSQS